MHTQSKSIISRHQLLSLFAAIIVIALAVTANCQDIETLTVGPLKANCYILRDTDSHSAIIIDPGADAPAILKRLSDGAFRLLAVVVTHGHEDHVGASAEVVANKDVSVYVHAADLNLAKHFCQSMNFKTISQEGPLVIGPFQLKVISTPGHTPGSICLLWKNNLFSGDTLFRSDIGTPQKKVEDPLVEVIRKKLFCQENQTKVYPGHGLPTSIGFEKKHNPFVRESPSNIPPIKWLENFATAKEQAHQQNKPILLLLTVKKWPCARGYEESLFQNEAIAELASKMIACRIDATAQPKFLEGNGVRKDPSHLPTLAFYDREGMLLEILEKLPEKMVLDTLGDILKGKRPLEDFKALGNKKDKTAEDYLAMGIYERNHQRLEQSMFSLESARKNAESDAQQSCRIEKTLLDVYTEKGDYDDALGVLKSLALREKVLTDSDKAELLLKKSRLYYGKKDYAHCSDVAMEFISKYQDRYETGQARLLTGLSRLAENKYKEALAEFRLCGDKAPAEIASKSLYLQGYCFLVQQEYKPAAEMFSKLVRDYPDSEFAEKAGQFLSKLEGKH